jgi:hypothetical protein
MEIIVKASAATTVTSKSCQLMAMMDLTSATFYLSKARRKPFSALWTLYIIKVNVMAFCWWNRIPALRAISVERCQYLS